MIKVLVIAFIEDYFSILARIKDKLSNLRRVVCNTYNITKEEYFFS